MSNRSDNHCVKRFLSHVEKTKLELEKATLLLKELEDKVYLGSFAEELHFIGFFKDYFEGSVRHGLPMLNRRLSYKIDEVKMKSQTDK